MNCEEIQNRLSEYLDGELAERECKLVEDHLENCPGCSEELAGLKECLKNLGSLDKIEPPSDFLSQVHARLETQSGFRAAFKKIIFPLHIKIPLEAAGLAAAAVLIFYILNISPERQSVQSPRMREFGISGEEIGRPRRITGATGAISYSREPVMVSEARRMKPTSPGREELPLIEEPAPLAEDEIAAAGGGLGVVELVLLIEPEAPDNADEHGKGVVLLSMQARGLQRKKTLSSEVKKEDDREAATLIRLEDLIAREGGEIISTEEMTDLTQRMAIKLPADHYHSFLEELSEISNFQPDQMVPPEESEQTIRLRLILIMKKKNFHD